jgi:hypothetical protein
MLIYKILYLLPNGKLLESTEWHKRKYQRVVSGYCWHWPFTARKYSLRHNEIEMAQNWKALPIITVYYDIVIGEWLLSIFARRSVILFDFGLRPQHLHCWLSVSNMEISEPVFTAKLPRGHSENFSSQSEMHRYKIHYYLAAVLNKL